MKKILFLSAIAVIFAACQSKSEYTISGEVADSLYEGQQAVLAQIVDNEMATVSSATITNGEFEFKGDTDSPVLRFITLGENESQVGTIIMLEPGKTKVVFDTDFHISGSPINNDFNDFNTKQKELNEKMLLVSDQHGAATADNSMTDELDAELRSKINKTMEEAKALNFEFVKKNIDNELGQYIFMTSAGMFDTEQQKEILAMASEEYKSNENVKMIIAQLEAAETVAIGQDFIDITMKDPEGETISLSDYAGKGKYVFIDFWAAWCGPCINEMPNVVEAYKKYKDKGLEIVGVSLDQDKDKWIEGIEELEMTWPQMSDLKLWESEAVALYGIRSIPHTVLLDKEGKIIAKDLRGEELQEKLAELLN
ncbi:MAG: AhpC/TSA family protein [Bacteroidales bacterium]|nr:AhpC/TSA family protein [Bacteroidales bacterium]